MDPQAALYEALDALHIGDGETAAERFRDLADWLEHGGFLPIVYADLTTNAPPGQGCPLTVYRRSPKGD